MPEKPPREDRTSTLPRVSETRLTLIFALGRFEWANRFDYEVGEHAP
jgi:hypothetical protein